MSAWSYPQSTRAVHLRQIFGQVTRTDDWKMDAMYLHARISTYCTYVESYTSTAYIPRFMGINILL